MGLAAAELKNVGKRRAVDPGRAAGERDRVRALAIEGLSHGLNVQLQKGCQAVIEKLDLPLAEHTHEVGRPWFSPRSPAFRSAFARWFGDRHREAASGPRREPQIPFTKTPCELRVGAAHRDTICSRLVKMLLKVNKEITRRFRFHKERAIARRAKSMKFGVGQTVRRREDVRLVTGQGRYTDDIRLAG